MSVSRKYFIFEVWFLFSSVFISFQKASGIPIQLTRGEGGTSDFFSNPYNHKKFCLFTNSMCHGSVAQHGDICRSCLCNVHNATFDLASFCCVPNKDSLNREECTLYFGGNYEFVSKSRLLGFDLTKSGMVNVQISRLPSGGKNKLQNCAVNEVAQMSTKGYKIVSSHTFGIGNLDWKSKMFYLTWSLPSIGQPIEGRIFKITVRCEYNRPGQSNGVIDDCIMLKSKGTVQIDHPGLPGATSSSVLETTAETITSLPTPSSTPSTPASSLKTQTLSPTATSHSIVLSSSSLHEIFPSSIAKESIKPTSTILTNIASSTKWTTTLLSSVREEKVEASTIKITSSTVDNRGNPEETVAPSSSSIDTEVPTGPEKEKHRSEKDGDAVVYVVIAVVIVVLVIVLIVAARLMMKRKKKKMMRKRESQANIVMSDMNKNNINQDDDETYTALDATKIGKDELNYEALTLPGARKSRSIADAYNEKMRRNEDEYIYADADCVYSTIEAQIDDEKLGAKNNAAFDANENERVYSILETEPGQIAYGTSSNLAHKPADQGCALDAGPVYSALDEERYVNTSPDYVTVLPPKVETAQSDCSIYTDLSKQRAAENQYQSLVKRKK